MRRRDAVLMCLIVLMSGAAKAEVRVEPLPPDYPIEKSIASLHRRISLRNEQQVKMQGAGLNRVKPQVIREDTFDDSMVFPAAGSVRGGGGTFFRSDITLVTLEDNPHDVIAVWLPQGGGPNPAVRITLLADEEELKPVTFEDFVGTVLRQSGLGAVLIFAANPDGSPDIDKRIDGFSRIWTSQPPPPARPDCIGLGTVSQDFPPVRFADSTSDFFAFAFGLKHNASYRTNAGVVNLDTVPHVWEIEARGSTGATTTITVTVPALAMQQVALPAGQNFGDVLLRFDQDVEKDFAWSAYGSSVDNGTGDGWVSHAKQP